MTAGPAPPSPEPLRGELQRYRIVAFGDEDDEASPIVSPSGTGAWVSADDALDAIRALRERVETVQRRALTAEKSRDALRVEVERLRDALTTVEHGRDRLLHKLQRLADGR